MVPSGATAPFDPAKSALFCEPEVHLAALGLRFSEILGPSKSLEPTKAPDVVRELIEVGEDVPLPHAAARRATANVEIISVRVQSSGPTVDGL